jgi:DnaJ family protein B protein 4
MNEIVKIGAQAKAKDVEVTVECSLFEFYNGTIKEVSFERSVVNENNDGSHAVQAEIKVEVKPGYSEKTTLRFPQLGHRTFGAHPSDLVIKFKLNEVNGGFSREGDDLVYHENVTLLEALSPKPVSIKTLDGRTLNVTPNELITPQTRLVVSNEGMPLAPSGELVIDT